MTNVQSGTLSPLADYDGFLFDLDGTLLDTLPDLVVLTNRALESEGFPTHTPEEILTYIGNGVLSLVLQAVPDYATDEQAQRVYHQFREGYAEYGMNLTKDFQGITQVLEELKSRGKKLGIMSNKFEGGVKDIEKKYFPGLLDAAHGETDTIPRKPEPDGLLLCAQEMAVEPNRCVYFGDSASDMRAAHRAGMVAVAVGWGYQPRETLMQGEPDLLIETPQEILTR